MPSSFASTFATMKYPKYIWWQMPTIFTFVKRAAAMQILGTGFVKFMTRASGQRRSMSRSMGMMRAMLRETCMSAPGPPFSA